MATTALRRKQWRGMWRLKGQIASIALVLAGGIACFISLRGTYLSLEDARAAYYDRYRFADVFARVERAPEELVEKIEALPSVEVVESRIVEEVTIDRLHRIGTGDRPRFETRTGGRGHHPRR